MSWKGDKLCGTHINWDYQLRTCKTTMPDYVKKLLLLLQHIPPTKPQLALAEYNSHAYEKKQYDVKERTPSKKLTSAQLKHIQQIEGAYLYYCISTKPLPLVTLGTISSEQYDGDETTLKVSHICLD